MAINALIAQGVRPIGADVASLLIDKRNQDFKNALSTAQESRAAAVEQRTATQFSQQQQVENTKLLYAASAEVASDPTAIARWLPQLKQAGVVRPEFDPSNVPPEAIQRLAMQLHESTGKALSALSGPETPTYQSSAPGSTLVQTNAPGGPRAVYSAPAKPEAPGTMYPYIGDNGKPTYGTAADVRGRQPYNKPTATAPVGTGFDDPKVQDLQAAISASGYSLPAGFRSKDQQLSLFRGLLRKYGELRLMISHTCCHRMQLTTALLSKPLELPPRSAGAWKSRTTNWMPSSRLPRMQAHWWTGASFVPFNRLKQAGQASISDPNLKRLFVATQTILNAYDLLAARGGTDKDKRAENHRILENADSPEAYNAALDMIVKEGAAAGGAAQGAMKAGAYGLPNANAASTAPVVPTTVRQSQVGVPFKHASGATVTILPPPR